MIINLFNMRTNELAITDSYETIDEALNANAKIGYDTAQKYTDWDEERYGSRDIYNYKS